jgi:flagellar basal body-associated protein FliL
LTREQEKAQDSDDARAKEDIMPIIHVVVVLIVVGVLLWLANTYLPLDEKIKKILNVVIVVAVVLWLLNVFFPFVRIH